MAKPPRKADKVDLTRLTIQGAQTIRVLDSAFHRINTGIGEWLAADRAPHPVSATTDQTPLPRSVAIGAWLPG